jgi:hypothetical protein
VGFIENGTLSIILRAHKSQVKTRHLLLFFLTEATVHTTGCDQLRLNWIFFVDLSGVMFMASLALL